MTGKRGTTVREFGPQEQQSSGLGLIHFHQHPEWTHRQDCMILYDHNTREWSLGPRKTHSGSVQVQIKKLFLFFFF